MGLDDELAVMEGFLPPMRVGELFGATDAEASATLARLLVRRRYASGEMLFHQGDPADRVHIVEAGSVRITIASVDGREGTIAIIGAGSVFGEAALVDGGHRTASAIAMEPVTTGTLDRIALQVLAEEQPQIRRAVMEGMGRWMHQLIDQIAELHFLDLRGRLAATLVRLARTAGSADAPVLLPPVTQAELASLVASTRQRVNAALGELSRDGLITLDGRRITVCDVDALARRIGG